MTDTKKLILGIAAGAGLVWFLLRTAKGAELLEKAGFTPADLKPLGVNPPPVREPVSPGQYDSVQPSGDATGGVIGSCGTCQDRQWSITFGSAELQAEAFTQILAAQVLPLDYLPADYPSVVLRRNVQRYEGGLPSLSGNLTTF